jgi:uncharacterized repeat protein (TIGR02543 family)
MRAQSKNLKAIVNITLCVAMAVWAAAPGLGASVTAAEPAPAYFDTGFSAPASSVVVPSPGSSCGWAKPQNGYVLDNLYATSMCSGDMVSYGSFNILPIPPGATIAGIAVNIQGFVTGGSSPTQVLVDLSWDGGNTYTPDNQSISPDKMETSFTNATSSDADSLNTLGGPSNLWGSDHTWVPTDFTNDNFQIRLTTYGGGNTVSIDQVSVNVYYKNVLPPALSSDDTLSNLTVDQGTLSPSFAPTLTSYSDGVLSGSISTLNVTPVTNNANATMVVTDNGGPAITAVGGVYPITLSGCNTIAIVVTAQDGKTSQTYTVSAIAGAHSGIEICSDSLSSLIVDGNIINSPTPGTTPVYTANVSAGVTTTSITPVLFETGAGITVTVNGLSGASGVASIVTLASSVNTIPVVVTFGSASNTYNVSITRAEAPAPTYTVIFDKNGGDTDAVPSSISDIVSGATVTLPTAPTRDGYTFAGWNTAAEGNGNTFDATTAVTADLTVYAQWTGSSAPTSLIVSSVAPISDISVANGTALSSVGLPSTAGVTLSDATTPDYAVTWDGGSPAYDGSTAGSYTFTGTLTLPAGVTNPNDLTASVKVDVALPTYTLTYTAGSNGTISGTSPQTVDSGDSGTAVTAVPDSGYNFVNWSDESTANPRIDTNVTADISVTANFASGDDALSNLTVDQGTLSPTFTSGTIVYSDNVPASVHALNVTPTTNDANATVTVNSNPATSGSPVTVPLVYGSNIITVGVTAQDGKTNQSYAITVTRGTDTGNQLSSLAVDQGTLTPAFAPTTNSYSDGVLPAGVTTLSVTPVANDSNATLVVTDNGGSPVTAAGGVYPVSLVYGDNNIVVAVNTPDATYDSSYTIAVTRTMQTYTLTYTAGSNGTISGISPQTVDSGDSGTPVTAMPNDGYHFVNWSDESTANPRTDTSVLADINVTANFEANPLPAVIVSSAAPISDINVANGTALSSLGLPATVEVALSDNSTTTLAVTWVSGTPAYDGNTANTYPFIGTLVLPDGAAYSNPNNVTAAVNAIVASPTIINNGGGGGGGGGLAYYAVTVTKNGNGSGSITANGSACNGSCDFPVGTTVALTATPASGSGFSNWTGACSGSTDTCSLLLNGNQNVGAYFVQGQVLGESTTTSASLTGAHPDGTLVLNDGTVYLIAGGQLHGFRNPQEFASYGYKFSQIVPINAADKLLPTGAVMKAMTGTIILDGSDNRTVYLIGHNYQKQGFVSAEIFKALGYSFAGLPVINLTDYSVGNLIASSTAAHPEGALILDNTGTVWWILNGQRDGFGSPTVFNSYGLSFGRVVFADAADMALPAGPLVKLRDGTLVLDGGTYYIISDGLKLPFASSASLTNWGYSLANVVSGDVSGYSTGSTLQ